MIIISMSLKEIPINIDYVIIYLSYFDCLVIGFNMDDYHSMTLKETQWFSEGNFLEIRKEGCGGKKRLQ